MRTQTIRFHVRSISSGTGRMFALIGLLSTFTLLAPGLASAASKPRQVPGGLVSPDLSVTS